MNFTYNSIINLGSHLGNLKKKYNKQMGFYALGFRNSIFIFNSFKILLSIINILILFKKLILYKCNFMGFSAKNLIDNKYFLKNLFLNFDKNWYFGTLIGGSLSNKHITLWKNTRWFNFYEDYCFTSELAVDTYIIINNSNSNNMLSELLNDFSILLSINDSNVKVDGITYLLPMNTNSIQSIYFFFKILEKFLKIELYKYNKILVYNKNINFYSLYLKRLLFLRTKLHKSKIFINVFRKKKIKKAFTYNNILIKSLYNSSTSFLIKGKKKKSKKYKKYFRAYIRYRIKSYKNNMLFFMWDFYSFKQIYTLNYLANNTIININYLKFNQNLTEIKSFRFFSFFKRNKRIFNKIIDFSNYKLFFEYSLVNKNIIKNSIFFLNPRFYFLFLLKNYKSNLSNVKNFLKVSIYADNFKNFLSIFKYFKKYKKFYNYILPKEWVFYTKYTVNTKKILKLEYRWFKDYKKYFVKKHNRRRLKRLENFKNNINSFDERLRKKFTKTNNISNFYRRDKKRYFDKLNKKLYKRDSNKKKYFIKNKKKV